MKKIFIGMLIIFGFISIVWVARNLNAKENIVHSSVSFDELAQKARKQILQNNENLKRTVLQATLLHEGHELAEQGLYEEAIAKYKESMKPEYLTKENDKSGGIYGLGEVHKMQGKYEEALKDLEWYMNRNPQKHPGDDPGWLDEKLELDALIEYQKTGNAKLIYQHIEHLKKDSFKQVEDPKLRQNMIYVQKGPKIIRLYDTLGDYESGIRFIDEMIAYAKRQFGHREVSEDNEYMKLRRAFEKDRAKGKHGTPTKLIIESDNLTY